MSARYAYTVRGASPAEAVAHAKDVARGAGWTVRTVCTCRDLGEGRWRVELALVRPEAVRA
jgi:hypothetical protein